MEERNRSVMQSVAQGIREAAQEYITADPQTLRLDSTLTVGISPIVYKPAIARIDATVTDLEIEWALEELDREGCFSAANPSMGRGNFDLGHVDLECLERYA